MPPLPEPITVTFMVAPQSPGVMADAGRFSRWKYLPRQFGEYLGGLLPIEDLTRSIVDLRGDHREVGPDPR
jgi:hypothetical protein